MAHNRTMSCAPVMLSAPGGSSASSVAPAAVSVEYRSVEELESQIRIAASTLHEHTRLLASIQKQLTHMVATEVSRISALAQFRAELQSLTMCLQTDPQQRKNIDTLNNLQKQVQEASQGLTREIEEKLFNPLKLIIETELKTALTSEKIFSFARDRYQEVHAKFTSAKKPDAGLIAEHQKATKDAGVAGEHSLGILYAANDTINDHTAWLLQTFHKLYQGYFQAGLTSLCSLAPARSPSMIISRNVASRATMSVAQVTAVNQTGGASVVPSYPPPIPPGVTVTVTPPKAAPLSASAPPGTSASASASAPASAAAPVSALPPTASASRTPTIKRASIATAEKKCLDELLDLERAHVNSLSDMLDFSQLIKQHSGLVVSSEDSEALFGPISNMFSLHTRTLAQLDKLAKVGASRPLAAPDITAVLAERLPGMEGTYVPFIKSESAAVRVFARMRHQVPAFAALLKRMPPAFDYVAIRTGALIHLRQYAPLLETVLPRQPPHIPQAPQAQPDGQLDPVLEAIDDLVKKAEAAKAVSERVVPLLQLKEKLFDFDIVDEWRALVTDGDAVPLPATADQLSASEASLRPKVLLAEDMPRHLYVFNDCWVLALVTGGAHRLFATGGLYRGLLVLPQASTQPGVPLRLAWRQQRDDENAPERTADVLFVTGSDEETSRVRQMIVQAIDSRCRTQVFGVEPQVLATRGRARDEPPGVPPFLEEVANIVISRGGLQSIGVFRVSVSKSELARLRSAVDAGNRPDVSDPLTAAALIRLWLRSLPAPLLSFELYDEWLRAGNFAGDALVAFIKSLIAKLPPANRVVLRHLAQLLSRIAKESEVNMMSPQNLAIVLAPSLIRPKEARDPITMTLETSRLFHPVQALVDRYASIFEN